MMAQSAKGTLLKIALAGGTLTTIGECFNISVGAQKNEVKDKDHHSNTNDAIPKGAIGRSSQDDITAEIYLGTVATHKRIADCIQDSSLIGAGVAGEITRNDSVSMEFTAAGFSLSSTFPIDDWQKGSIGIMVDGLVEYPLTTV